MSITLAAATLGSDAWCQPANDDCANAIAVVSNIPVAWTTLNATNEAGALTCLGQSDVWFEFTAPIDAIAEFVLSGVVNAAGAGTNTNHSVYLNPGGGFCPTDLDQIACINPFSGSAALTAGTGYLIRIGGSGINQFSGILEVIVPVPNDDCADAESIEGSGILDFNTTGATLDEVCNSPITNAIWYEFQSVVPGFLAVEVCSDGTWDPRLGAYNACGIPCFAFGANVASPTFCSSSGASLNLEVTAGDPILLAVGGVLAADKGPGTLTWRFTPSEDECSDAALLLEGPHWITTADASSSIAALPPSTCGLSRTQADPDIWFRYQATRDGSLRVHTLTDSTTPGTPWETSLAVFTGPCANLTVLGCDALGDVSVPVIAGQTYTIRVSTQMSETGVLRIEYWPKGADGCQDATPAFLGDNPIDTTVATTNVADDPPVGSCAVFGGMFYDVWYLFTAPHGGVMRISFCNSTVNFDTDLELYTGTCGGDLSAVICSGDAPGCDDLASEVFWPVDTGDTFFIRVGGWSAADQGSGEFNISILPPDPVINEVRTSPTLGQFVEIFGEKQSLDGLSYVAVDGSGTVVQDVSLDGWSLDSARLFTIADFTLSLPGNNVLEHELNYPSGSITHFILEGSTAIVGDDLDSGNDGAIDFPLPWDRRVDHFGQLGTTGHVYSLNVVGPVNGLATPHAQRCPDGSESVFAATGPDTPDALNNCAFLPRGADECELATPVFLGMNFFDTLGATPSTDPIPTECVGLGSFFNDIWLVFEVPASVPQLGTLTVSTCDLAFFDTSIAVYRGSCGNLIPLGCDDDGPAAPSGCTNKTSLATGIQVEPNEVIYIRIGGFEPGDTMNNSQVELSIDVPPRINEIRTRRTDASESFELIGMPNMPLGGYWYLSIGNSAAGQSGVVRTSVSLAGLALDKDGFLYFPESGTVLNFGNSENETHLLVRNFSGFVGQDLDTFEGDVNTLDPSPPWFDVIDSVALLVVGSSFYTYSDTTVGPAPPPLATQTPDHVERCQDQVGLWTVSPGVYAPGLIDSPGMVNICPIVPANDECTGAFAIGEGMIPFYTEAATDSNGGIFEVPGQNGCGSFIRKDLWYSYSAPANGFIVASTCGQANFDTSIMVYEGPCSVPGNLVGFNCDLEPNCDFTSETPPVPVTAGNDYLIRVGGFQTSRGGWGMLGVEFLPAAMQGDTCEDAVVIVESQAVNLDLTSATPSGTGSVDPTGCPGVGLGPQDPDAWFSFTSVNSGVGILNACSTSFDTVVAVYDGTCGPATLSQIACNDDSADVCLPPGSSLQFEVIAGTEYLIRFGGANGETGTALFTVIVSSSNIIDFRRGDCNADGQIDLADAICNLVCMFQTQNCTNNCDDSRDCNDDDAVNMADPICILGALFGFAGGPPVPIPGSSGCFRDPAVAGFTQITCTDFPGCP